MPRKKTTSLPHVHFMGICGSGMSAVASIAKSKGYQVSGCDQSTDASYFRMLKKQRIPVFSGHSPSHLADADLLAVSPAVIYQNEKNEEYQSALSQSKAMTWQEFMGKYLHQDKKLICVSGTHGKSTTTSLLGLCLESGGLDPTVELGATVKSWGTNFRIGKSKYFISEADEYNDNFLHYSPETIIINNLELDHPDFFASLEQLESSFIKFVQNLVGAKNLILNLDSIGLTRLATRYQNLLSSLNIRCFGYTLQNHSLPFCEQIFRVNNPVLDTQGSNFKVDICSQDKCIFFESFKSPLPGLHNISNMLGVIIACHLYSIPIDKVKKSFLSYPGISRRMEEVGEKSGIKVFSDYAHHPTAVKLTLESFRQKYPGKDILVVFQPHTFSRLKSLIAQFSTSFETAKKVYCLPVFASREKDTGEVSSQDLVQSIVKPKAIVVPTSQVALDTISQEANIGDIIVFMGAGDIHTLATQLLSLL